MARGPAVAELSRLGVFRGSTAVELGLTRKKLATLVRTGLVERVLPDTYRMTALPGSNEDALRAALVWAGGDSAAHGSSAAEVYGLEGVRATKPEIVVPSSNRVRGRGVIVRRASDVRRLMIRTHRGFRVTGIEPTLVALAGTLEPERFEIACEDARRRGLTSVPALRAYLRRFGQSGVRGVAAMRALLAELDPVHPSRSALEVMTRRLLVANGYTDFARELPLEWNGHTYRYDFAFERQRTILETNGRRWHDDPSDYERDNEKWSVPARHRYRIVFATWAKVTHAPDSLLEELDVALGR